MQHNGCVHAGLPFCKEIPTEGPRSVPRSRGMLVMLRAYVNPATGVGPDPSRLIPFRTVVATPRSEAGAWDTRPYKSDAVRTACQRGGGEGEMRGHLGLGVVWEGWQMALLLVHGLQLCEPITPCGYK